MKFLENTLVGQYPIVFLVLSEDVGLADSNALRVALAAAQAAEMVGMPEARIPLAHAICVHITRSLLRGCKG